MSSNPNRFTPEQRYTRRAIVLAEDPNKVIAGRTRTERRRCRLQLQRDIATDPDWYYGANAWPTIRKLERWYRYR